MNYFQNIFTKNFLAFLLIVAAIVVGGIAVRAQNGTPPDGDGGNNGGDGSTPLPEGGFPRGAFLTPPCALGDANCVVWTGLTVNEDLVRRFTDPSTYDLPENGSLLYLKQDPSDTFSLLGETGPGLKWFDNLFADVGTAFVGSESRLRMPPPAPPFNIDINAVASEGNQTRGDLSFGANEVSSFTMNLLGGNTADGYWQPGQSLRVILCNTDSTDLPPIGWFAYEYDGGDQIDLIWPNGIAPGLPAVGKCSLYSFFASASGEVEGVTGTIFGSYVENFE